MRVAHVLSPISNSSSEIMPFPSLSHDLNKLITATELTESATLSCSAIGGASSLSSRSTLESGLVLADSDLLKTSASSERLRLPEPSWSHMEKRSS